MVLFAVYIIFPFGAEYMNDNARFALSPLVRALVNSWLARGGVAEFT